MMRHLQKQRKLKDTKTDEYVRRFFVCYTFQMEKITFVTGNDQKVVEMERILGIPINRATFDLPEIQSLDLETVAGNKAERAYEYVAGPVIVEDTSLVFHALGRLPGTFIKWFTDELGHEGMCALLAAHTDRSATAAVCIAYHDGEDTRFFHGACNGSIAEHPRDGVGFGFDHIFIPEGHEEAWSELSSEVKDKMSHRAKAASKLAAFLKSKN